MYTAYDTICGGTMYTTLPPKGMRDFLPRDKALRDEVANKIRKAYASCGFTEVETSIVESIENLTGGDGGENQKLVFRILKRGEKLSNAESEDQLADLGLRFDFTLPLTRFYSNNRNELPNVFKSIQMGMVFRGERPQKGRYRSFVQCDVDVIGEASQLAEIEILNAASKALDSLGIGAYEIKISDRRFLTSLITQSGIAEEHVDSVCISLDKYDKIGRDGVLKELEGRGIAGGEAVLDKFIGIDLEGVKDICEEAYNNLRIIMGAFANTKVKLVFDPTLVRGMGYYTATIFEVFNPTYGLALGGGGRYDKMVGKISGTDAPAAGFSIGFERICDLLLEKGMVAAGPNKLAILVSEPSDYAKALEYQSRDDGFIKSIYQRKKKFGKQLANLEKSGYTHFVDMDNPDAIKLVKNE